MNKNEFREIRIELNLTQKELASKLELTSSTVSNYETGLFPIQKYMEYAMKYIRFKTHRRDW